MSFGDNIQSFINQIFAEDTAIFKFLEENSITMVFSNNKLHCNKNEFVKAFNHFCGTELIWPSILRNFNYYRMSISHGGSRDGYATIIFPADFSLDERFIRHTGKYSCEIPGCEYSGTRSNLMVHMRNHKCERPFSCEVPGCGYSATTITNLNKHVRTHTSERSLKCPISDCSYTTTIEKKLKIHMFRHNKSELYPCNIPGCGYVARMHGHLRRHMRIHNNETGRQFQCEVSNCGFIATQKIYLYNHMRSQHTEYIEKPLEDLEKPLEDIGKPLEDIKKPKETSIFDNPEIAKILEDKLPVPKEKENLMDDGVIDVDDQTTVIDVDDDATVVDDDATVVDDDITMLTS